MIGRSTPLAVIVWVAVGLASAPVAAHSLKLFVTVDGMVVSGHGFFVGGGRPQGVVVKIRDADGRDLHDGRTDANGAFAWTAPAPAAYTVLLDTGDGHFTRAEVTADRFVGATSASTPAPVAAAPASGPEVAKPGAVARGPDAIVSAAEIEAAVDRALARRLQPLVEAQERSEARLRFADIMGGIGMIVGLAGLGAWGMARRREREGPRA
ncbi:cobalamin biosynthesis protein CbiM [Pinisolibacter aquiterrae]|uniref:cobalamin biosynthesis protein CbiM n=1 Tax=Pinisolibacter aquiterrae TaxID=2815579 RepID=UPI001C3D4556|nr:cobalamin biosynthesis protein CbiM [Pinisolibacter aquiterrae]MBV5263709.1 cobalamin biosynthesis protein CbiM [Pinisolibacter aquiterrae]MCC8235093.1 cobalamin biosynthesis protein CbiM [Pinisolibacter aquiterrae]